MSGGVVTASVIGPLLCSVCNVRPRSRVVKSRARSTKRCYRLAVPAILDRLQILQRLVAFDTTSSKSNLACVDFLCELLDRPGVRLRRLPSPDGSKANLLVELGPPSDARRSGLMLSGHTDVVPALEPDWSSDPFTLTADGDRLAGRGSADMKGFIALAVETARNVELARLRAPLALLFTYDEEVGTLGAQRFADEWSKTEPLPRLCVIGEPTSLGVVRMHKGHLKLRVVLRGAPAHSSMPHLGRNAIETAARAVAALGALRDTLREERSEWSDYFGEVPCVTLNVARIEGGVAVNVVPERCVIDVGLRLLPGMRSTEMIARVRAALEASIGTSPDGVTYTLEENGDSPPLLSPADAPHAALLCALVGQTEGRGVAYASDGGPLQALAIDSVLFGPGSIDVAHRANEWLPRAEFDRASGILARAVEHFCGHSSEKGGATA